MRTLCFLLLLISNGAFAQQFEKDSATLIGITQALVDAIAPGDTAVWIRYLHPDCIYTAEDGTVKRKPALIKELQPLPAGYVGSIKVTQPHVLGFGNTYIVNYVADENLDLYQQHIHTQYIETQTYLKNGDQFQLVASEIFELFADPMPAAVPVATLQKYTGTYHLSPEVTYTITLQGNQLMGQRNGRTAVQLIPETENVFYIKGQRGRKIFIQDAATKTGLLIDRRNGNDLVWKK